MTDYLNRKQWQYPKFDIMEFTPKRSRHCVCVFVINEGDKVRKQLGKMQLYAGTIDIIIADGGSTDGSLEPDFLKSVGVRTLLTKRGPGKLSAQMRMAFAYALDQGYEGVVVIDGNGKDDVSALPSFIDALDQGFDHIQGSRYVPGGKAINTPFLRHLGVMLLHAPLISLASGHKQSDTTNGFRAYSAMLLSDPRLAIFRDVFQTYELHYYLAIRSGKSGYKLTELPVTRAYPAKGKTPTKISPIKGNLLILSILYNAVTGKYDPKGEPKQ